MMLPVLSGLPPWMMFAAGGALGWLRNFWQTLKHATWGHVVERVSVSLLVEKDEHGDAYGWLLLWMESQMRARRISGVLLRRKMAAAGGEPGCTQAAAPSSGSPGHRADSANYDLVPDYNTYRMRWRERYVLSISHTKGKNEAPTAGGSGNAANNQWGRPEITLRLAIWGTRDRGLLLELIEEARAEFERTHPAQLEFFTGTHCYWESHVFRRRGLETIYLDAQVLAEIVEDMAAFLRSEPVYRRLGIPYRKGYGFFGPPGTGKTSLVQALATNFNLPLYYLNLNSRTIDSDSLPTMLGLMRTPSILLLEDVDCLTAARGRETDKDRPALSTADLLNALDGIVASEGRVVMMTSNHPERLDPALVRAGRLDRKWVIGVPGEEFLRRFHAAASEHFPLPGWDEFAAELPEKATLADAQALAFGVGFKGEVLV